MVRTEAVEEVVWKKCRSLVERPAEAIELWRRRLQERQAVQVQAELGRSSLQKALSDKEAERERVMTLFRRGRISLDDVEG